MSQPREEEELEYPRQREQHVRRHKRENCLRGHEINTSVAENAGERAGVKR